MAKKSGTQAPRLEALRFGELEESAGDELDAHGGFENLRISGADLPASLLRAVYCDNAARVLDI